jgi:hypothetical protein
MGVGILALPLEKEVKPRAFDKDKLDCLKSRLGVRDNN